VFSEGEGIEEKDLLGEESQDEEEGEMELDEEGEEE